MSRSWKARWQSPDLNPCSLASESLFLVIQPKSTCLWMDLQVKVADRSPGSNLKLVPSLLPRRGSWGGRYVSAEQKAAGKGSSSPLLPCAGPPQLSTSPAAFSTPAEYRRLRKWNPTLLWTTCLKSTPQTNKQTKTKSFHKAATMRLGYSFCHGQETVWNNTQRVVMTARSSEVRAIYRVLICKGNIGEKTWLKYLNHNAYE